MPDAEQPQTKRLGRPVSRVVVIGLVLVLGAFGFFVFVAPIGPSHRGARDIKCRAQLHQIVHSMSLYAEAFGGRLPPAGGQGSGESPGAIAESWADVLIETQYILPEFLVSPAAFEQDRSSYLFVPADRLDGDPTRVLLYELPGMHGEHGVHVAYHDGHIETLPLQEAERLIAALTAAHGPASQPPLHRDDDDRVRPGE